MKNYGILEKESSKSNINDALHELKRNGYTKINSGLSQLKITEIQSKYNKVQKQYLKKFSSLEDIDEHNTIRAPLLFERVFLDLALNKNVISILHKLCGKNMILNQQNGITNPPKQDYNQAFWHRDLPYQHFTSSKPLAMNALFCVDDFTKENGATAVLPGTHLFENFPSDNFIKKNTLQVEARAGDFIICDAMVYHSGQYNFSNRSRRGINHVYTTPIIRRQIDFSKSDFNYKVSKYNKILGLNFNSKSSIEEYLNSKR
jgi:ectoine hydroxylase-related dioxygenase (phytanoyl-CoA dioxygenase family)